MRIPFGTPTVSDATKLGVRTGFDGPFAGVQLYQLFYLPVITELFNDLSAWDVTDSSGSNIAVSGNVLSMNGNDKINANGIVLHAGITAAEGVLEYEFKNSVKDSAEICTLVAAKTLTTTVYTPYCYIPNVDNVFNLRIGSTGYGTLPRTYDVWYKLRLYLLKTANGSLKRVVLTVQGGTEYVDETEIGGVTMTAAMSGTIYPQFQRRLNNAGALSYIRNLYWKAGFATDGPTLTYVADAGAGKTFGGFVPTNLAAVGSWATTNVRFKYSYDDGTPAYNASWLTLAQLNAETALTTSKRYIRIQVQVNSDGATQQYAGEINADDATSMPAGGGYPAENDVRDGTTFGASSEYEGNLALPAEANVVPGVGYGSEGTEFEGSADLPALSSVDPLDTLLGDAGTMDVPDLANILPADTLRGVPGTSDKLYSAAEEAARNTDPGAAYVQREADGGPASYKHLGETKTPALNTAAIAAAGYAAAEALFPDWEAARNEVPDLAKIPTEATGGPAPWDQLGVEREGTLDLDAAKLAFEAARNDAQGTEAADIIAGNAVKIRDVTITGSASAGGDPPDPSEWDGELSLGENSGEIVVPIKGTAGVRTYVFWRIREDGQEWSDPDINFSVVGEGTVTLTGLDLGYTWEVDILSYSGGIYGRSPGPKSITLEAESSAATDNINTAKKAMKQSAVYWPRTGTDEFGKPSYGDATEIDCRWDEVQEEFIAPDGTRQLSMAKLIVDRDLKVGGVLYLGGIADLTDVDDPKSNEGAWEIRGVKKTPSFKGTKFLREVYL